MGVARQPYPRGHHPIRTASRENAPVPGRTEPEDKLPSPFPHPSPISPPTTTTRTPVEESGTHRGHPRAVRWTTRTPGEESGTHRGHPQAVRSTLPPRSPLRTKSGPQRRRPSWHVQNTAEQQPSQHSAKSNPPSQTSSPSDPIPSIPEETITTSSFASQLLHLTLTPTAVHQLICSRDQQSGSQTALHSFLSILRAHAAGKIGPFRWSFRVLSPSFNNLCRCISEDAMQNGIPTKQSLRHLCNNLSEMAKTIGIIIPPTRFTCRVKASFAKARSEAPPCILQLGASATSFPLEYPTVAERQRLLANFPSQRSKFVLPGKSDRTAWKTISTALQNACVSAATSEELGARGLDNLHVALHSTLTSLGYSADTIKPHNSMPHARTPFRTQLAQATSAVRTSRKWSHRQKSPQQQLSADRAILSKLTEASEEEMLAQQIRHNHRLSVTNPKKLADKIWCRAMSSDPPYCDLQQCADFFTEIFRTSEPPTTTPSWLPPQHPSLPLHPLTITPEMVRRAIAKKSGSCSAPGLDGITYQTLAQLPWIPALLAQLFNKLVGQQTCPEVWRYGTTVLLHKGGNKELSNYRPITLTPTIAKLFHSIVAAWLEPALISSGVISTDIQKGFIMGVSGAVEHDLVLDALLSEAQRSRKKLSMVLVDLKNAFGSVPHSRIIWALKTYGVPNWVQQYVSNLYSRMFTQMTCKLWTTEFLQVQRGVLQGDTLSPLLFLLVMQVGLHALTSSCPSHGFRSTTDDSLHFLKCFADDLTIVTTEVTQLQSVLTKYEAITAWLGLEMKPSKCRAFSMNKGKYRRIDIIINGETILNVEDAPTKFLGMQLSLHQSFKEKAVIASQSILQIISALDLFPLPKQDKVLLYKRFAIPKMRWVLTVQDLLPTALSRLNQQAEKYLKEWWHLPRATSRDALRLTVGIPSLTDLANQGQLVKYSLAQA